ncbi:MAG: hypothetical protein HOQ09_13790 [Gemmatimonadaceae bacterium]|nr:hypothetical protein [Gemmatimonadaceae bacterium]
MNTPQRPKRRPRWITVLFAMIVLAASASAWLTCHVDEAHPNHRVRDGRLARLGVVMYTPADAPRALVVFFGNDVGFWGPHQQLAADLAGDGYAVVGVDIRPLFASLPDRSPQRDSVCAATIADIVARARSELSLRDAPLVVAGHSLGAELALWTGAHVPLEHLAGLLALAPGSRSHLQVSPSDLLGREPTGPESFALSDVMVVLRDHGIDVAIVRGANDKLRDADSVLIASGGPRTRKFLVPFAGHSMRKLVLARFSIEDALRWLLAEQPRASTDSAERSGRLSAR